MRLFSFLLVLWLYSMSTLANTPRLRGTNENCPEIMPKTTESTVSITILGNIERSSIDEIKALEESFKRIFDSSASSLCKYDGSNAIRSATITIINSTMFSVHVVRECGACFEDSLFEFQPRGRELYANGRKGHGTACLRAKASHCSAPKPADFVADFNRLVNSRVDLFPNVRAIMEVQEVRSTEQPSISPNTIFPSSPLPTHSQTMTFTPSASPTPSTSSAPSHQPSDSRNVTGCAQ